MATATTTMWALETVKSYLAVKSDNHDGIIEQIADGVSSRIETDIRRYIVTRAGLVEIYDGPRRGGVLRLRSFPVSSVTLVELRSAIGDSWESLAASGYELDGRLGELYRVPDIALPAGVLATDVGSGWPTGSRTVRVTYSPGWGAQEAATIPRDLWNAGLEFVKYLYALYSGSADALTSVSMGPTSISVRMEPPSHVRDVIEKYRPRRF